MYIILVLRLIWNFLWLFFLSIAWIIWQVGLVAHKKFRMHAFLHP